jgi:hypothetical protein
MIPEKNAANKTTTPSDLSETKQKFDYWKASKQSLSEKNGKSDYKSVDLANSVNKISQKNKISGKNEFVRDGKEAFYAVNAAYNLKTGSAQSQKNHKDDIVKQLTNSFGINYGITALDVANKAAAAKNAENKQVQEKNISKEAMYEIWENLTSYKLKNAEKDDVSEPSGVPMSG